MRAAIVRSITRISTLVEWMTILLTGALVVLVSANVVARYLLQVGLIWAEELSRLAFVWVVFFGAFVALRKRSHLAITFVTDHLPPRGRSAVRVGVILLTLAFLGVVVWGGTRLVLQTVRFGRVTPMLGISAAWGYLGVPVAAFLMFLEVLRVLLQGEDLVPDGDTTLPAPGRVADQARTE